MSEMNVEMKDENIDISSSDGKIDVRIKIYDDRIVVIGKEGRMVVTSDRVRPTVRIEKE